MLLFHFFIDLVKAIQYISSQNFIISYPIALF